MTTPAHGPAHRPGGRAWRLASLALIGWLSACAGFPFGAHDRDADLTRDDFREALAARPAPTDAEAGAEGGPPIPELQRLVELPPPLSAAERRLVSVAVNETVPLKDVLIELARKAEVDLALDPRIEGGIILTMHQRPLGEVIERIADLAGLRFQFQGRSLRIELDEPYYVNYRLDYLDIVRQASSNVETSTNVMSDAGVDGNASSSAVSGQSDLDFWQELEASLTEIMANAQPRQLMVPTAAGPPPVAAAPAPTILPAIAPPAEGAPDAAGQATPAPVALSPAMIESLIGAPADEAAGAGPGDLERAAAGPTDSLFTINRQAGIVSVFASARLHQLIEAYLATLRELISRQVLIEAKIFEVQLSDRFQSGINWRAMIGDFNFVAPLGTTVAPPPFGSSLDATRDVVTMAFSGTDLEVIANFIQRFGTVRTLSSPRLAVLHNQTAVLKVAENQVFFRLFFERIEQDDGDDQININSEIRTVPVGLIMTVQPSINAETDEISMALRPTVTRVIDVVQDPAVAIASNNTVQSEVPVIAVQEIDSVVTMNSGQVVVMGGLMRDFVVSQDDGVPVLGQLPGLGYLFKARDDQTRKTELVIFLRATIVDDVAVQPLDAELYQRFGGDRRPFTMPARDPAQ